VDATAGLILSSRNIVASNLHLLGSPPQRRKPLRRGSAASASREAQNEERRAYRSGLPLLGSNQDPLDRGAWFSPLLDAPQAEAISTTVSDHAPRTTIAAPRDTGAVLHGDPTVAAR
jgi:hypothetical protein